MTTDWREVVNDPEIHVVIELVGGTGMAKEIILSALKLGKPVITANKALLSAHGEELFAAAKKSGANLYYEASVCGGIPIIKSLREGFVGNRINALYGIVNGTCNYILTRMKLEGADFAAVLADAQKQGYAETPPDLDIDGQDAQHKIGILASLAHGFWVDPKEIHVEGIRHMSAMDIKFAGELGYTIKLLGIVKRSRQRTRFPARAEHVAACRFRFIRRSFRTRTCSPASTTFSTPCSCAATSWATRLFYGRGAGKDATASAVLSDLADAALDLKFGTPQPRAAVRSARMQRRASRRLTEVVSQYFVRLNVVDKPGMLAKIAAIFGQSKIGISSVIQPEGHEGESVPLIFMLHYAPNGAVTKALAKIGKLPVIKGQPVMIRVENFEG